MPGIDLVEVGVGVDELIRHTALGLQTGLTLYQLRAWGRTRIYNIIFKDDSYSVEFVVLCRYTKLDFVAFTPVSF